ncbi:MAG: DUF4878 domain-containing protein [Prevotellaceae bacterium]|jgi:hypothetical protein|nr:DUF4878 domain-containing protein [Prevotellaceae bacterium]
MKKIFQILSVAVIVLTAASCGGGTPSGIAKSMFKASKAGDSEKVVAIASANLNDKAWNVKALHGEHLFRLIIKSELNVLFNSTTEIAGYSILDEKRSDDGLQAVVTTKVTYKDGSETTDKMTFVKENGKWKIKLSHF